MCIRDSFHGSARSHLLNSTSVLLFLLLLGVRGVRCQDCEQVVPGFEQANHCSSMKTVRNPIRKEPKLQVTLTC